MDKKQDQKAYAHAEKAYMQGTLFSYIKVGMQKVNLTPTVNIVNGEKVITPNAPVYIYDTSGPFSDPNMEIDLKKGLPRIRESWITGRGDVEQLPSITSEYGKMRRDDKSLDHLRFEHIALPYRAKAGKAITQMAYAKAGIVTPEMEYVAIRENMNCRELGIDTFIIGPLVVKLFPCPPPDVAGWLCGVLNRLRAEWPATVLLVTDHAEYLDALEADVVQLPQAEPVFDALWEPLPDTL